MKPERAEAIVRDLARTDPWAKDGRRCHFCDVSERTGVKLHHHRLQCVWARAAELVDDSQPWVNLRGHIVHG